MNKQISRKICRHRFFPYRYKKVTPFTLGTTSDGTPQTGMIGDMVLTELICVRCKKKEELNKTMLAGDGNKEGKK